MKIFKAQAIHTVNLILILATAIVISCFCSYKKYTLYEDGKWDSTKTHAGKALLAAWTTLLSKSVMSKNQLDISGWHGYQQFIFKKALKFETIGFRSRSFGRPFSFILDKTDSSSTGIYFNYKKDTCCFFISDSEGKFLQKNDFFISGALSGDRWAQVRCSISSGTLRLFIRDHLFFETKTAISDSVHIGFRGSRDKVYIDDVDITTPSQHRVVIDDFNAPWAIGWQAPLFLLISLCFYLIMQRWYAQNMILLNFSLLLGMFFFYLLYFYWLSGLYQKEVGYRIWPETFPNFESGEAVFDRIKKEFPVDEVAGKKPVILFVGSSQTWGAGASAIPKTYAECIGRSLKLYFQDTSITVINTGVQGARSDELLAFYKAAWIDYKPVLTVIDLSTNDYDTAAFRRSIREFIDMDNKRHIKTLLVLEPNDTMSEHLSGNYKIMREEGMRGQVSVVDMQSYTDSCADSGFLWWDYVHMTDYGYHLFADRLTSAVIEEIKADSTLSRH